VRPIKAYQPPKHHVGNFSTAIDVVSIQIDITNSIVKLTERKGCEHGSLLWSNYTREDLSEFQTASKEWVLIFVSVSNVSICHGHDQRGCVSVTIVFVISYTERQNDTNELDTSISMFFRRSSATVAVKRFKTSSFAWRKYISWYETEASALRT
jgi:hypothetical protein